MELPIHIKLGGRALRGNRFLCIDKDQFLLNAAIPAGGAESYTACIVWARLDQKCANSVIVRPAVAKMEYVESIPFCWDEEQRVIYHMTAVSSRNYEHRLYRTSLPTSDDDVATSRTTLIKTLQFCGPVQCLVWDSHSKMFVVDAVAGIGSNSMYAFRLDQDYASRAVDYYYMGIGTSQLVMTGPEDDRLLLSLTTDGRGLDSPIDGLYVFHARKDTNKDELTITKRPIPVENEDPKYQEPRRADFRDLLPHDIFCDASPHANVYMTHFVSSATRRQPTTLVRYTNVCANAPQPKLETVCVAPKKSIVLDYCCHLATGQLFMLTRRDNKPGSPLWIQPVPADQIQVPIVSTRDVVDEFVRVELSLLASVFSRDLLRIVAWYCVVSF